MLLSKQKHRHTKHGGCFIYDARSPLARRVGSDCQHYRYGRGLIIQLGLSCYRRRPRLSTARYRYIARKPDLCGLAAGYNGQYPQQLHGDFGLTLRFLLIPLKPTDRKKCSVTALVSILTIVL